MPKTLTSQQLKKLIKLEMKHMMDEDALMPSPELGDPYYLQSIRGKSDYDHDHHAHHDECEVCSAKHHNYDCECDVCSMQKIGIFEGCGCGGSVNPYEEERKEDYHMGAHLMGIDNEHHDEDHGHSSYMARPQLRKIAKYASKLLDMVGENEELEDWQESKIAQMAQMIGDVYHSIEYDEDYEEETSDDDLDVNDLIGMIRTGNI